MLAHVPLSQAALAIIERLPKHADSTWLLPNPQTLLLFTDIKRSFVEARRMAGLDSVHIDVLP